MHLGDVTDTNKKDEFELAIQAHDLLAKAGIPYTIASGNHEYKTGDSGISDGSRSKTLFHQYFNDEYIKKGYSDVSWFEGFKYGTNMAGTFNVGHIRFAVFALEYAPRKDALCWVEDLIQTKFRDHYVIITTHAYLDYDAGAHTSGGYVRNIPEFRRAVTGVDGEAVYKELAARYSNVIMVACGHMSDSEHRNIKGYNGNSIHETLVDYQSEATSAGLSCKTHAGCTKTSSGANLVDDAGNGWLRLMEIDPRKTKDNVTATTIRTFDTDTDKCDKFYCTQYYSSSLTAKDHKYTTTMDLTRPIEFKYSMNNDISFLTRDINHLGNDVLPKPVQGLHRAPAVAMNRDTGAFVSTWQYQTGDGKNDIYARGFCAGGCAEVEPYVVNTTTKGDQRNPDIAMAEDGSFVIVWEDDQDGDGKYEIRMRGFDSKGKERIAETSVVSGSGMSHPAIAMAPNGNYVVTWKDASSTQAQIAMRGFSANGQELFAKTNVTDAAKGTPGTPDIAMASDGSFVIVWEDDASGNFDIMARGFDASGTGTIKTMTVNSNKAGAQRNPSVAMNASGNFMVTWEDDSDNNKVFLVFARGFKNDGSELYKAAQISQASTHSVTPVVCMGDDNKSVFAWESTEDYVTLYDGKTTIKDGHFIYRRVLNKSQALGSAELVYTLKNGVFYQPAAACTGDGKHVVLFSGDVYDDTGANNNRDILGRGYNN